MEGRITQDNHLVFNLPHQPAVYLHTADKYHRPSRPTITGAKRYR
jgi:hypothetical protein